MERLHTAKEVAAIVGAGCGVETIRKAYRSGELAGVKIARSYGFYLRDVEAWLAAKRSIATVVAPRIQATLSPRSLARRSARTS